MKYFWLIGKNIPEQFKMHWGTNMEGKVVVSDAMPVKLVIDEECEVVYVTDDNNKILKKISGVCLKRTLQNKTFDTPRGTVKISTMYEVSTATGRDIFVPVGGI